MFCIFCGRPIEEQSAFCSNCGAAVADMGSTAAPPSMPPPDDLTSDTPSPTETVSGEQASTQPFLTETASGEQTSTQPFLTETASGEQTFTQPPLAEAVPAQQTFVPTPSPVGAPPVPPFMPGMSPGQQSFTPPPPPLMPGMTPGQQSFAPPPFMDQPSAVPFMPMAEDFSSAKIISDAAKAAIAALPPVQMVVPADEGGGGNVSSLFKGEMKVGKNQIDGRLWITDKQIVFIEYAESGTPTYDEIMEIVNKDIKNNNELIIPTRMVHSIVWEKVLYAYEFAIYTYDELKYSFEINGKNFLEDFGKAVPGLTIVNKKAMYTYYANMSKTDPRNPNGTCYNPRYPRGYVVAEPYEWRKKPQEMDYAINIAKRDGSLPMEWNKKISSTCLPPGVPCLVHSMF